MKKIFSTLCFCLFLGSSFALVAQEETETIAEAPAKNSNSKDRLVIEFMHNNWAERPDGFEMKWYNRGINAYVMYDIGLIKEYVSVGFGGGISSSNYYNNSLTALDTAGNTIFTPIPSSVAAASGDTVSIGDSERNKLSTTYFDIPLELRFRTKKNKMNRSFKAAVGIKAGICLDAHTKYRGDDLAGSGREIFVKDKALPNINRYHYGVTARLGYHLFNVVGYYSLSTLFEADKGPGIHPFSIGISFNGL